MDKDKELFSGKLDTDTLKRSVLDKIKYKSEEVTVKAGVGIDCAVLNFEKYDCVVSSDPITSSNKNIGILAIDISCNDIASCGIKPIGITLVIMMPKGSTENDIAEIMETAGEEAAKLEVEIIGGHTEVTDTVNTPILISTAIGRIEKGKCQTAEKMSAGDAVIITKTVGIEGTGIIANEREKDLLNFLSQSEIEEAKKYIYAVSVIEDGTTAAEIGTHGMHDVTEGGILGAIWEMCNVKGLGVELIEEDIPISRLTRKITEKIGVNPLKLISSGTMLIIASQEKKEKILEALNKNGIDAKVVGEIKEREKGLKIRKKDGSLEDITAPKSDEIHQALTSDLKK